MSSSLMSSNSPVIESITCPINGTIMKDPVQGNDGQTYERSAITEWLTKHQHSSPITKQYMTVSDLKVNASIRFLCDKYHSGELGITSDINNINNCAHNSHLKSIEHPKIISSVFKNNNEVSSNPNINSKFMVSLSVEDIGNIGNIGINHDVVIVIDRSGSMQTSVEAKDLDGNKLEDGLSQQDIVNHSAKMIAKTLGLNSNNRLAIIAFDNLVENVFNLMPMSEINCSSAILQINDVKPRGQTAIWQAIENAINILFTRDDKTRNPHIILLTDGIPNISPARGEVTTIQNKMNSLNFYPPIYTFGFGYNLKPDLLYGIAKISNAATGHIPDAGMIATVFSNFISTIMCTIAYNMQLTVHFDGENIPHINGDFKYDVYKNDNSSISHIIIHIGSIQIGQSRDIIISDANITKYTYNYLIGDTCYENSKDINSTTQFGVESNMYPSIARFVLVEKIRMAIKLKQRGKSALNIYNEMIEHFNDIDTITEGSWGSLMYETLTEQIYLALSDELKHAYYFQRWGMWYLDQISSALCHQIKPNFKDTACCFGGKLFNEIVDYASDQFDNLPPPTPSNIGTSNFTGSHYQSHGNMSSLSPIRMSTYNSQDNPCFDGNCLVSMANGSLTKVSDLVKGDKVISLYNPYDINTSQVGNVVCILKTVIAGGICKMVSFDNGLKITPWHPIINEHGDWKFPFDMKDTYTSNGICEQTEVYSILLDNYHTCRINDTWCICLGHNYTQGILKHEYFGSQKIVDNMRIMHGWYEGLIEINSNDISRDMKTGLICEINQLSDV